MAHGSEDYWMTKSNLMRSLFTAIKDSVGAGGNLQTTLDLMDGKLDGVVDLTKLTDDETGLLAKLLSIKNTLITGSDLLNKLDALDGTVDGKLDVTQLTTVQADLLAKLTGIETGQVDAATLLAKLDTLDGTMDGKLDVTQLTAVQADLLAKLTGIDTSLLTGGDLLDKLDALDGTMDGKLDLAQLNASSVKTNLDTVITRLNTSITKLTDQLTEITGVHSDTTAFVAYGEEDWTGETDGSNWVLVSDENVKRNMLKVTNTGPNYSMSYSRDGGSTVAGTIAPSSSATFHSAAGVWVQTLVSDTTWSAHEEWAT